MHVIHIDILQLHQSECLLEFKNWIKIFVGECFSCYKKLLSLASSLLYHLIDCISQGDFVIVKSCGIDVSDADFKTLFE